MHPTPEQIAQISAIAHSTPTEEVCGYIVDGRVVQMPNVSDRPDLTFKLPHPVIHADCFWHSHVNGVSDFSVEDIKAAKELEKPYFLYCVKTGKTQYFDPNYIPPYLGREFHWAWQNCYTLMQHWYKQELGIELPDYYLRSADAYEYEDVGYSAELPKHGFVEVQKNEPIQKHDIVLMHEGCPFLNHVGIVTNPDKNEIIHHLFTYLSKPGRFGRKRRDTGTIWRHRSLWVN